MELSKEHRPWGYYEVIFDEPNYKLKRIVVNPNSKLSLQKHSKREEHWTVVSGNGFVHIGYQSSNIMKYEAKPGLGYYIPCGAIHRVENNSDQPLTIIEVQTGSYFGEDDIVRFDDDYGRDCKNLEFAKNLEDSQRIFGTLPSIKEGEGI